LAALVAASEQTVFARKTNRGRGAFNTIGAQFDAASLSAALMNLWPSLIAL